MLGGGSSRRGSGARGSDSADSHQPFTAIERTVRRGLARSGGAAHTRPGQRADAGRRSPTCGPRATRSRRRTSRRDDAIRSASLCSHVSPSAPDVTCPSIVSIRRSSRLGGRSMSSGQIHSPSPRTESWHHSGPTSAVSGRERSGRPENAGEPWWTRTTDPLIKRRAEKRTRKNSKEPNAGNPEASA